MYAVFTERVVQIISLFPKASFIEFIPLLISSVSTRVPRTSKWNIQRRGFVYSVLGGAKLNCEGWSRNPVPVTEAQLFPTPGLWLLDQKSD